MTLWHEAQVNVEKNKKILSNNRKNKHNFFYCYSVY